MGECKFECKFERKFECKFECKSLSASPLVRGRVWITADGEVELGAGLARGPEVTDVAEWMRLSRKGGK